jgi:transitional endoplasmic reticulum ATPase
MNPPVVSLRVLTAYARDVGRGVARIDGRSMDILGVSNGDVVEIIGKKDGTDARCY